MRNVAALALTLLTVVVSSRAVAADVVAAQGGGLARANRLLILGNSITTHGPSAKIGWTNNCGMAASSLDKDYAHLLAASIAEATGKKPAVMIASLYEFEKQYASYDADAKLKPYVEFKPETVIVAIGENVRVTDAASQAVFKTGLVKVLSVLKKSGEPTVFVRSCFWANAVKDALLKQAAEETGCVFVDIGALGKDPSNYARSERQWANAGVGNHPGDKGMRAIADALLAAIRNRK